MSSKHPNILIVMADQHNARYLGAAGHPVVATPAIDRLAAEGVRFDAACCASPLCGPSRMSFLTGLYPFHTGVYANGQVLASDLPTYAHAFGAGGYDTALIGRMHITGPDQCHGFEEKLAKDVTASSLGGGRFPQTEGIPTGSQPEGLHLSGPGGSIYQHYDETVTDAAVEWIGRRQKRPWMATVGFALPHNPYVCSPADYAQYADRIDPPHADHDALHPLLAKKRNRENNGANDADIRRTLAAYAGSVTAMDRRVGRILDALDAAGERENTIVVYTADHGEAAGEHGLWNKCTMMAGSVAVPLVIRLPNGIGAGSVRHENINLIDLAPTLLELAGLDPLPDIDGRSLAALLGGQPQTWDNVTFSEYGTRWGHNVLMRMVCRDQWKYIYYDRDRPSLFDRLTDPEERHDLAGCPEHADRMAALKREVLSDWSPEEVNTGIDRWNRRNSVLYKWFASRDRKDDEIYRGPPGANRLDALPEWTPVTDREFSEKIGSY